MPLDHAELTHWFLTNGKLHTEQATNTQPAHVRLITSLLYTGNNHTYSIIRADPGNANWPPLPRSQLLLPYYHYFEHSNK